MASSAMAARASCAFRTAFVSLVLLACSESNEARPVAAGAGGASISTVGGGAGTGIIGVGGAGGSTIGAGGARDPMLPPPWQYYARGSEFGFKDPSLPNGVKDLFGGAVDASGAPA